MSRIDEALRRAAGTDAPPAPATDVSPARGDSILERFPGEPPAAAPRPDPDPPLKPVKPVERRPSGTQPAAALAAATPPAPMLHPVPPAASRLDPADVAAQGKLIVNGVGRSASLAADQYRRVAAALHELHVDRGLSTVMITSALPQEGKTLTVSNLALTLSESYARRVLLIDADLRRPTIHTLLGIANGSGLSEALASPRGELPLVSVSSRLSVLTSGRPAAHPLAGLTSERMRAVLEEAASRFDWVLLDTPPVALLPDAPLLAGLTQGVIFVIRAGATPFPTVERAIGEVGRERIVGTVLNRVEERAVPESSYAYYDSYRR